MENWKKEIKRLNALREKQGFTFYKLEQLSGRGRGRIGGMFKMVNEPSLGLYLAIKDILEKDIEVTVIEKKKFSSPKQQDTSVVDSNCDCRMDGMLFIRGKSGCKKAKDEHKF